MSADAPGRPGRGRGSALPAGRYEPPSPIQVTERHDVQVLFEGEDGRRRTFTFAGLPLPGLHGGLARAFVARCGTTGPLRTLTSASSEWVRLQAFLRSLAELPHPPSCLADLRVEHLKHHRAQLGQRWTLHTARSAMAYVVLLLKEVEPGVLAPELVDFLGQRGHATRPAGHGGVGEPGYSERELAAITAAARRDTDAIRRRITAGETLLDRALTRPQQLAEHERADASALIVLAGADSPGALPPCSRDDISQARKLFLTRLDLTPLLVLGVVLTGRNVETLKELPTTHQVLEERAVAVAATKRRRGKAGTHSTVHWEIDSRPSRQLHAPGSFYLLLHALMSRSRGFSQTRRLWSIWAGGSRVDAAKAATGGHIDPFACHLSGHLKLHEWVARHGLLDDDGARLQLSFNRLKTTIEVRTTRAVGGHLPSAVRTNTPDVLYAHYLRNDPRVHDWAQRVLTEAFDDAEAHARAFTPTVLADRSDAALVIAAGEVGLPEETAHQAAAGMLDTLLGSCLDIEHSPFSPGRCTASFLTCLQCPNALILERHLPRLLALADHLQHELDRTSVEEWARRYGAAWTVLVRFVLPRFTDAQRQRAAAAKPTNLCLDLLDGPREQQ